MTRLDEIRARLDLVTPGEWRTEDPGPFIQTVWSDNATERYPVAKWIGPQDARFIANAPADVGWLLAEIGRLREGALDALECLARGDAVLDDEVFSRLRPLYDELRLGRSFGAAPAAGTPDEVVR